jgi:hypothetical protein
MNIEILLKLILKIPNQKTLRLYKVSAGFSVHIHYTVDIDATGVFGHEENAKELFLEKLDQVFLVDGLLVVREFFPSRIRKENTDGKEVWINEKNLYGILIKNQQWFGLRKEYLKAILEEDSATKTPIAREEGVHYQNFAIVTKPLENQNQPKQVEK